MTIREALNEKREQLKGKVNYLVLCKGELFYLLKDGEKMGNSPKDTVYPVSSAVASKEARFFGVAWSEE